MKIIIMGCGRVGATLATMMVAEKHEVTVIDQSGGAFARLGTGFPGTKLVGDGTDEEVLRRAGIERAESFVAATNGDNRNIMAAQIAKHTFGVPRVICRIYDPIRQQVYQGLGLDSICPTIVGAQLIHDALLHPERAAASAILSLAEGRSVPTTPVNLEDVSPTTRGAPSTGNTNVTSGAGGAGGARGAATPTRDPRATSR